MRFRARWSQLYAGSGQGRITSSFKAMVKPETERLIQFMWACLSSYEDLRASHAGSSQCCVFSMRGMTIRLPSYFFRLISVRVCPLLY